MRKRMLLALLCAALLAGLSAWAEASDSAAWVGGHAYEYHYHATRRCRLARLAGEMTRTTPGDAEAAGKAPCPVCWPESSAPSGVTCYERGGTLVIRIPDRAIREQMFGASVPTEAPQALLRENENPLDDIARLVHGADYCRWAEGADPGTEQTVEAVIPDLDAERTDALLMCRRHIGAAWVLLVRPNEAIGEACTLPVIFYRVNLRVATYAAGSTLRAGDGSTRWTGELALAPKKSGGEVVWRDEAGWTDAKAYVVRDGGINVAVFRKAFAPESPLAARFEYCAQSTRLAGYVDGEEKVYCCALTDGEVNALRDMLGFSLYDEPEEGSDDLSNVGETFWEADHAPETSAILPDGTVAVMDQAAYPVGTGFVSYTLTRPKGGVTYYNNEVDLSASRNERWVSLNGFIKACADGDPERRHSGYFCDHVTLVVPLQEVGALEPGLYRLTIAETFWDGANVESHLEFRVAEDAPKPAMPERRTFGGEGLIVLPHTPPSADAATYNSCADDTRAYEGGNRTRVLAGDMVFDLRGVDESWGWGVCSAYNLFAYPEGRPEQAKQILAGFNHEETTMYDLGDGLLLASNDGSFWRCDYDGGNLSELGKHTDDRHLWDLLPVGDGVYFIDAGEVCYASLAEFEPRPVYTPRKRVINDRFGRGYMVYAEGKLIVADDGIVALDTARPNPDGTLPATRLTDEYADDSGVNGYGYIALGGRLYGWSAKRQAMISMDLDGTDIQEISKARYWFNSATPGGVVLALWGTQPGFMGDERAEAALFFPMDPEHPTFDPEHCKKRAIEPDCYEFVLGDYLYHRDAAGNETRQPLGEVRPE